MRPLRRLLPLAGVVNAVWLAWWSVDAVIQARRWAESARKVNPLKIAAREAMEESIQRGLDQFVGGRVKRRDDLLDEE